MIKKNIFKLLLIGLLCFCSYSTQILPIQEQIVVYASTTSIKQIDAFENLTGDSKYIGSQYRDQYYLDIEKTGMFDMVDKFLNYIANLLFFIIKWLGAIITTLFYQIMTLDVASLFSTQINEIQRALKSSIFDSFFVLAFVGSAWMLLKKVSKRDLIGFVTEIGKVVLILLLSSLVVTKSSTVLTATTEITKSISVSALLNINDPSQVVDIKNYAASAGGVLWKSLVHDPWLSLEFNETIPTDDQIQAFLTTPVESEEREQLVEDYRGENPTAMKKSEGVSRIGFLLIYLVPFVIKCVIYGFMSAIQFAFQIMALCYVLLAPIILLLALVPAFGGIDLITTWLKKILESQIMIVVVTFIMGVVMKLDSLLYEKSGDLGWLIVIVIETIVALIVILNYKSILKGIGKVGAVARHPKAIQYELSRSGNVLSASSHAIDKSGQGVKQGAEFVNQQIKKIKQVKQKHQEKQQKGSSSPMPKRPSITLLESFKSEANPSSLIKSVKNIKKEPHSNQSIVDPTSKYSDYKQNNETKKSLNQATVEHSKDSNKTKSKNANPIKRPNLSSQIKDEQRRRKDEEAQEKKTFASKQSPMNSGSEVNQAEEQAQSNSAKVKRPNLSSQIKDEQRRRKDEKAQEQKTFASKQSPMDSGSEVNQAEEQAQSNSVKVKRPSLKSSKKERKTTNQSPQLVTETYSLNTGSNPTHNQLKNAPSLFKNSSNMKKQPTKEKPNIRLKKEKNVTSIKLDKFNRLKK